jgi:hypothetical protein
MSTIAPDARSIQLNSNNSAAYSNLAEQQSL